MRTHRTYRGIKRSPILFALMTAGVLFSAMLACKKRDNSPPEPSAIITSPLMGTAWATAIGDCLETISLSTKGIYLATIVCKTADGTRLVQHQRAKYGVAADAIVLKIVTFDTCKDSEGAAGFLYYYRHEGDELTLFTNPTDTHGIFYTRTEHLASYEAAEAHIETRLTKSTPDGEIVYGCFNTDISEAGFVRLTKADL